MRFSPRDDDEVVLDMTPLIDMVFQLLIFFLLTTTFSLNVKENGLLLDLPQAKAAQIPSMASQVKVGVLEDGRLMLGGQAVSEEKLRAGLAEVARQNPDIMLVLQADQRVEHQRVVRVMDLAAGLGLRRLGIATLEE
ncbi:MAG TPA: biopolymer transporter ExbD [Myxococcota bacterium]|nr:biopolymer transporter ExbD [Myxococcota bacterium]HRY93888.1 biopolymer transporter ExbD [Myxococcota bacterium]